MEIRDYIRIARRWLWLLILGPVLGGLGGYYWSNYQTPVYQSSTRFMSVRPPQEAVSDYTYLSDQQMTQTYVQMITTRPILEAASEDLGYSVDNNQITVRQVQDTQIVQLAVEDENPEHAAEIANMLVQKLTLQNENYQTSRFTETENSLREQIKQMEEQIAGIQTVISQISSQNLKDQTAQMEALIVPLQDEITTLETEIAALPTWKTENKIKIAEKQARIDQIKPLLGMYQGIYSNLTVIGKPFENGSSQDLRLAQLQSTLDLYQQIYINLLNSQESIRLARLQNTPNIVQIEPALPAKAPIRPRPLMNTGLAAAVGLMLAAGIVFLIEYLDDTLKGPEDVERALGVPVLGFVAEMKIKGEGQVYVTRQPRSPVSEAFRSLRTNLEFASVQQPIQTLLVTSPGPGAGKTTVAVNLAAIFSQTEKKVALVDADMRRPHVHRFLELSNREGLSNLFRSQAHVQSVIRNKLDLSHLTVITSGGLPPNPAELLGSERMSQILNELKMMNDMVVIDTPPSMVADAQVLAGKVDAVLFVVQPGVTQTEAARTSLEVFRRAGARVVGVVLNRIPRNRSYYYGGYKYYSPYVYNQGKEYFYGAGDEPIEQPLESSRPMDQGTSRAGSYLSRLLEETKDIPPAENPKN